MKTLKKQQIIYAKILCLWCIGNFFMVSDGLGQVGYSDIHDNSVGMSQSWNCGFTNPALLGSTAHQHYGVSITPSPYEIKEFTNYGLCGELPIDTTLLASHGGTYFMRIQDFSFLSVNIASAWRGHDMPFLVGVTLKSEFASFGDGILHCMQIDFGMGGIMIIDENMRISCVLRSPLMFPASQRLHDIYQPLLIIGAGFIPNDEITLDLDVLSSVFGSGLRPKLTYQLPNFTEIHMGFSNLHRSVTLGISTIQKPVSLKADIFYHLNLGFSWQFGLQYVL